MCLSLSDFEVVRFGTCAGYHWTVVWAGRGGDIPEMTVDGSFLYGEDVHIFVLTLQDGGTWLRPLRGDMIRTADPETTVGDLPLLSRTLKHCQTLLAMGQKQSNFEIFKCQLMR